MNAHTFNRFRLQENELFGTNTNSTITMLPFQWSHLQVFSDSLDFEVFRFYSNCSCDVTTLDSSLPDVGKLIQYAMFFSGRRKPYVSGTVRHGNKLVQGIFYFLLKLSLGNSVTEFSGFYGLVIVLPACLSAVGANQPVVTLRLL